MKYMTETKKKVKKGGTMDLFTKITEVAKRTAKHLKYKKVNRSSTVTLNVVGENLEERFEVQRDVYIDGQIKTMASQYKSLDLALRAYEYECLWHDM